jgi:hypothetical protein
LFGNRTSNNVRSRRLGHLSPERRKLINQGARRPLRNDHQDIWDSDMNPQNLDSIATQFYNAGLHYSAAIQPYALKLFFALFLIDIIVTWLQYSAEGQLDHRFFWAG